MKKTILFLAAFSLLIYGCKKNDDTSTYSSRSSFVTSDQLLGYWDELSIVDSSISFNDPLNPIINDVNNLWKFHIHFKNDNITLEDWHTWHEWPYDTIPDNVSTYQYLLVGDSLFYDINQYGVYLHKYKIAFKDSNLTLTATSKSSDRLTTHYRVTTLLKR